MHDTVAVASRGKTAVVVVTEEFEHLAHTMAANAGRRACASTCCRTRSSRSEAEVRQIAREHWPRLLETLGAGVAPMSHDHSEIAGRVDCGPEGCESDWLTSARLEVDDDLVAFQKLATDAGWGDGLPLVPPTEERGAVPGGVGPVPR